MMKYLIVVFFLASVILGCSDPNQECCDEKEVSLGESFSIIEGESVSVESSIVQLTFVKLIDDSLCPEDVQCITQGTLAISIDINGTVKNLSIGDTNAYQTAYKDYNVELQKLIYPTKQGEKDNGNSTYAVQMVITRP